MKAALVVNSKSKRTNKDNINRLYSALTEHGIDFVEFIEDGNITMSEFADAAVKDGFDVVIAAGGDGTISSVATKLVGTNTALGVIPLGTYNNFSKDLGVPQNVEEAVKSLIHGETTHIDVGEVNGHHFINNSSIGLYPHLVIRRERREGRGMPRIFATFLALLKVFQRFPAHTVKLFLGDDGVSAQETRQAPMLFFGNGVYGYDGLGIGDRTGLVEGKLSLYILKNTGRFKLLKLSIKALSKRIHSDSSFEKHLVTEAVVELPKKYVYVSKDGEILKMESPLKYKIKPKALKVILPKKK